MAIDGGVVLITGASSGIGRSLALELVSRAKVLILVARREERLHQLEDRLLDVNPSIEVVVHPCDLSDRGALDQMCTAIENRFDGVDVLINNAGLGDIGFFVESKWAKIEQMLEVNVRAPTYLCHRFLPQMIEQRRGSILNVSSGFGLFWFPFFTTYVGTKHYLSAFTECLRTECRGTGVTVTQLCPGPVATEFEAHADSPIQTDLVRYVSISSEKCARLGVRALEANRALVQMGWLASIGIWLCRISPRWVQRWNASLTVRLLETLMRRQT